MTVSGQPEVLKGTLAYQVNITGKGWLDWGENDVEIGAAPEQLPIEAVAMKFTDRLAEYYDIYYSVWENGAWTEWAMNGTAAGAEGSGIRVEGLRAAAVLKGAEPPEMKPEGIDPTKPMAEHACDHEDFRQPGGKRRARHLFYGGKPGPWNSGGGSAHECTGM